MSKNQESPSMHRKCFSPTGVNHDYSFASCNCNSTLLHDLENWITPHVSEHFACCIKDRTEEIYDGQSVLHTEWGKLKLVSTGPAPEPVQTPLSAFFKIEREVGMSRNSIDSVNAILT